MSVFTFPVTQKQRLDILLAAQDGVRSRVHAKQLIKDGCVRVDGIVQRQSSFLPCEDSIVRFDIGENTHKNVSMEKVYMSLQLLYEDDDFLVIDKPAGVAVHPGHSMPATEVTILDLLAPMYAERSLTFTPSHVLVHRLDKNTTGCLLVAKNAVAHRAMQHLFERRNIRKIYLALCVGLPSPRTALIDSPIGRHLTERTRMSITKVGASRHAKTLYRTLDTGENASLLSCDLQTGRTHQIRVHLSSIGHPLLGDSTYANSASLLLTSSLNIERICLHAWTLDFPSPFTQKTVHVESEPPSDFQSAAVRAGITATPWAK